MVRVTHPPGGKPMLECDAAPCPKTVRVLKPPGGGSSISFGDDDGPPAPAPKKTPAAASNGSATPPDAPTNGSATPPAAPSNCSDTPSAVPSNDSATPPAEAAVAVEVPTTTPSETVPSSSDSNGTAPPNGCSKSAASDDFPPIVVELTSVSSNGTEVVAEVPSTNGTADVTTNCTNGTAPEKTDSKPDATSSPPSESTNGTNDTKNRFFGATDGSNSVVSKPHVARSTPSNHHMRSSIFPSHEESLELSRTKPKSASSPTKEEKKAPETTNRPQPPHRVRQPPGGYSTQLW